MKSNTFHMSMLLDYYGELLTEKQREMFDLYYNEDLSLTEIAEHVGISRQGVRDAIMRGETILRDTEDKLGFYRRYSGYETKLQEIAECAAYIATVNAQVKNYEIATRVDKIVKLVNEMK